MHLLKLLRHIFVRQSIEVHQIDENAVNSALVVRKKRSCHSLGKYRFWVKFTHAITTDASRSSVETAATPIRGLVRTCDYDCFYMFDPLTVLMLKTEGVFTKVPANNAWQLETIECKNAPYPSSVARCRAGWRWPGKSNHLNNLKISFPFYHLSRIGWEIMFFFLCQKVQDYQ